MKNKKKSGGGWNFYRESESWDIFEEEQVNAMLYTNELSHAWLYNVISKSLLCMLCPHKYKQHALST